MNLAKSIGNLQKYGYLCRYYVSTSTSRLAVSTDLKSKIDYNKNDFEAWRSRLYYQSKKRGILENDIIFGDFADQSLKTLTKKDLEDYDSLINGDTNEWDLFYYVTGISKTLNCYNDILSNRNVMTWLNESTKEPWYDHMDNGNSVINCHDLNLPNSPNAQYFVTIKAWNNVLTPLLLKGMSRVNIISLVFRLNELDNQMQYFNLGAYFKELESLSIEVINKNSKEYDLYPFFSNVPTIQNLKLVNVPFKLSTKASHWIKSIKRFYVDNNKELVYLPKWFSFGHGLVKLIIKNTLLAEITPISLLPNLENVRLSHNEISHIHRVSFVSEFLEEVDLSHNKITKLAAHTFSQSPSLRYIDLSYNHFKTQLPERAFFKNSKLKYLSLANSYITHLNPEAMIGLQNLRTLVLSYNPGIQLDIFTLLPLKSLQKLDLNWCNLTKMPMAVSQCCHLNTLQLSGNLFYTRDSMPSEVLAMLSNINRIDFDRNPLVEMPYGLFLVPLNNVELIEQILETIIQLPLWQREPCTPYMWHIHLSNSTKELQRKVAPWNEKKMAQNSLQHCRQLYESTLDKLDLYRELEQSSGCEATRKLRSAKDSCDNEQAEMEKKVEEKIKNEWLLKESQIHSMYTTEKPRKLKTFNTENYLMISIATNIFLASFLSTLMIFAIICRIKKYWDRREHDDLSNNNYQQTTN
uniref:TIR domain-containing protein n=1 Tax=Rhabditophanes sp. KR3021 TaxID=114890 RepID=A0AC35TGZ5_9BILA